jgi:hypothetical protein
MTFSIPGTLAGFGVGLGVGLGAAHCTLRLDHVPFLRLHVPEVPPMHAKLAQASRLSPTWKTWPSGQVHDPPQRPTPSAFSVIVVIPAPNAPAPNPNARVNSGL